MNINSARTLFGFQLFRVLMFVAYAVNIVAGYAITTYHIVFYLMISFLISMIISDEFLIKRYIQKEKENV